MTVALMAILLILGFDPLPALLTAMLSVWFYRFTVMFDD